MHTDNQFTPFWFEANLWFQMVNNSEDLNSLVKIYQDHGYGAEIILNARECTYPGRTTPKFGLTRECSDERRLRQFFEEHNMKKPPEQS